MTWPRCIGLAVSVTLIGLVGAALWALPEIVRREAVTQIAQTTGRPTSIRDVDFNPLTGRLAFKGFRLGERAAPEAFLELERLDARLAPLSLFRRHVHLTEIKLTAPAVRVVRTGPTEFNFSDLLALIPPADAPRQNRWTVTLDEVELVRGSIVAIDRVMSPPREWRLVGLTVGGGGLTTGQAAGPGHVALQAKVGDMALAMDTQSVRLGPGLLTFRVSLEGLEAAQLHPYLPPDLPAFPDKGKVGLTLVVVLERAPGGLKQAVVSGDVRVDGLALTQLDRPAPFATAAHLSVGIKAADLLARTVTLSSVELEGFDVRMRRDPTGNIDLLTPAARQAEAGIAPARPAPGSATLRSEPFRVGVERVALKGGTVTFNDEAVAPARQWRVHELVADARGLTTSPGEASGRVELSGRVTADPAIESAVVSIVAGSVRLSPLAGSARGSVNGIELAQLAPYLPPGLPLLPPDGLATVNLTVDFERGADGLRRGLASGDVRVADLALTQPGSPAPFATIPQLAVSVKQADLVARTATLTSVEAIGLNLHVRRDAQGKLDLLSLFEPTQPVASASGPRRVASGADGSTPSSGRGASPPLQVRLERLDLKGATLTFADDAVSPPREWLIQDLALAGEGLTTFSGETSGRLDLRARVSGPAETASATDVVLEAHSIRLSPLAASVRASVDGLELAQLGPYLPSGLRLLPPTGTAKVDVALDFERGPRGLKRALATGEARLRDLTLTQPGAKAPFATVPQLIVALKQADLVAGTATLQSVEAEGLDLRARRDSRGKIDLLAMVEPSPIQPGARQSPSRPVVASPRVAAPRAGPEEAHPLRVRVEHLGLDSGTVTLIDEAASPAREWRVEGLTMDAQALTTSPSEGPGRVELRARVSADSSTESAAVLLEADAVRLSPLGAAVRASVDGLELGQIGPYLPAGLPFLPPTGKAKVNIAVDFERGPQGLKRALATGEARVTSLALTQPGGPAPFATLPQLAVALTQADLVARTATLKSVEANGADIRAFRDRAGKIDILALAPAGRAPTAHRGPSGSGPQASADWRVKVERLTLTQATATFEDSTVSPRIRLALTDVALIMEEAAWPSTKPGPVVLTAGLPGGGRIEIKGSAGLTPFQADVYMSMRDAPIEPYQAYFPFKARLAGRFSGDSRSQIKWEQGELVAASQGTGWTEDLEVRAPGSTTPVIRGDRMEFRSIDFGWPNYARVARITMKRPFVRVERGPDGEINLRRLFASERSGPPGDSGKAPEKDAKDSAPRKEGDSLYESMLLDFGEIIVEDGSARFLDRTTRPAFSGDVSRLAVRVRELSNTPGQRARVAVQGILGEGAALELNGQISPLASEFHADLVGQLRDFPLASLNPYVASRFPWVVDNGRLDARLHYRVEADRLTGTTDAVVRNLEVGAASSATTAQVENRTGLPLDKIVSLIKDQRGEIRISVPVYGSLGERHFDFSDAIWTAVQNSFVNIIAAPFKMVGRVFSRREQPAAGVVAIEPVSFSPGSAVIAPGMEDELRRAASFLRASPGAGLSLVPVATAPDLDILKGQELAARLQNLERERQLPDGAAALRVYFKERLPELTPPQKTDEQLALLRERQPVPEARVADLLNRRIEAIREALVKVEGIEPERLVPGSPATAPEAPGDGLVEFTVIAE